MRYILLKLITIYQFVLSPLFPSVCRFYPTCSEYSREAIIRHGIIKGLLLTFFRIFRCNPLFKSGHDPVPDDFSFFKSCRSRALSGSVRHPAAADSPC
ncbi:MAG: membrane protein insertion efficiency factor YidD, partial [Desulfonatronovibrio sp.]